MNGSHQVTPRPQATRQCLRLPAVAAITSLALLAASHLAIPAARASSPAEPLEAHLTAIEDRDGRSELVLEIQSNADQPLRLEVYADGADPLSDAPLLRSQLILPQDSVTVVVPDEGVRTSMRHVFLRVVVTDDSGATVARYQINDSFAIDAATGQYRRATAEEAFAVESVVPTPDLASGERWAGGLVGEAELADR
ncbi:MAG: hypothetical protein HYV63_26595 [Candidatus Schekmanbacteria bacterium]|nr:hypothetical protein [Candidatus Schekmanbacteria bacterium]